MFKVFKTGLHEKHVSMARKKKNKKNTEIIKQLECKREEGNHSLPEWSLLCQEMEKLGFF